ncbi:MAG: peptidase prolyl oligopeptidase active site domain protein, partial [Frankiales bacterium]|nr:peptidase prolyl oligopeptidase active site domain protein [Frankiales bacterium]
MEFTDLSDPTAFQALPRLAGLALSPDGTRLVTGVATLDPKGQKWLTALWEVDPAGAAPAVRLTRSAKGEGSPVFTAAGDVLFTSARPDPDNADDEDPTPSLWLLPGQGEARPVGARPGGVGGPVAKGAQVVVSSATLPAATDGDDDAARRKAR